MLEYYLEPRATNQKSFNKKAKVIDYQNGTYELISYNAKVARSDHGIIRASATYSAITLKHIKEFIWQYGSADQLGLDVIHNPKLLTKKFIEENLM